MVEILFTFPPQEQALFFPDAAVERLKSLGNFRWVLPESNEFDEAVARADIMVTHRDTPGDRALFRKAKRLKAYIRAAVDPKGIDFEAAREFGVEVHRSRPFYAEPVAEWVVAGVLAMLRRLREFDSELKSGQLEPARLTATLSGAKVGIVGYGAIAKALRPMLKGLGCDILAYNRSALNSEWKDVRFTSFDDVLDQCDTVICLASADPNAPPLFNERAFSAMRPGAIFVNAARPSLVDEEALYESLEMGHLGGAVLDVGTGVDLRPAEKLARRADVLATPHSAGLVLTSVMQQANFAVDQAAEAISNIAIQAD